MYSYNTHIRTDTHTHTHTQIITVLSLLCQYWRQNLKHLDKQQMENMTDYLFLSILPPPLSLLPYLFFSIIPPPLSISPPPLSLSLFPLRLSLSLY